ncbi:MAG: ATP-dependent Clp protease ATP-binding subunit [Candidatus Levyibacteriota bacterium]
MIEYAKFYSFYTNSLAKTVRLFLLVTLLWFFILAVLNIAWFLPFALLSLFLIFEIFFRFKIAKITPKVSAQNNDGKNPYQSFTLQALALFKSNDKSSVIIKNLLNCEQIKFMVNKSDFSQKEIQFSEISKEELAAAALNVVKEIGGKFVTTMDVFTAFILLNEPNAKLLFSKKLKREDFLAILFWARNDFPNEENPRPWRVDFWGEGIGEEWVYGWTLETKKYARDITNEVLGEKPALVGRDIELKRTIEVISGKEKNNVLLVGEPGSGKTSIVKRLCFESFTSDMPGTSYHQRIFELMIGSLLAGTQNQGDLEARLQAIIEEISHAGNVIIFIPEFQNILGSSSFHLDLSGALLPYLKKGNLRFITTSTPGNFKTYIEQAKEVLEVFEIIKLQEPDKNSVLKMLLEKAKNIEKKNKISLSYRSILTACDLADKYMPDRVMPGSGVLLLSDVANSVYLSGKKIAGEEDVVNKIEEKTKIAVAKPKGEEKELLLHLEDKLHERIVDQKEAVIAISEALRRLRSGLGSATKPISFLFLGPTGVGKTETAKALAAIYFGGEEKMIRLDMSEYTGTDGVKRLLGAPPGQGSEKGELTDKIYENPFSLVLLDEFEKANPEILNLFLQVFEDGRLTDNKGKTVSFLNSIIIATSNAGSEFIREEVQKGSSVDKGFQAKLLDFLQTKGIFKPELLNRLDGVIVFQPLGENEVAQVAKLMLDSVSKKLLEQDIMVSFSENLIVKVAKEGFDKQFGARPLRRFIQDNIEDFLAQKILKDEIKRGDKIILSTDANNNIILQ